MIQGQLSSLPTDGAAALASGATDASGAAVVKNLGAPLFPEGGCGTPGPWQTATPGPPARYRAGGCTDGQYVYVYGGGNSTGGYYNDLWRWDPVTQTWTQLANMPTAKQNIQGAYWNGKIYVPGGFNGAHITENAIYDIATNTWTHRRASAGSHRRVLTWLSITRFTISVATPVRKARSRSTT